MTSVKHSFSLLILNLMMLGIAVPARAEFDPVTVMESIRNNKISEARTRITDSGEIGREYLRRYAQIFLPAVARIGNLAALNLFIDILGKDGLNKALDSALVAVFDNPKFGPLIKPLLSFGANPSANAFGQTALARAAFVRTRRSEADGLDAARLLLKQGANPNIAEDSGMTPLMLACSNDDEPLIKLLLDSGANPEIVTKQGRITTMMAGQVCTKLLAPKLQNTANTLIQTPDEIMIQSLYQAIVTNDVKQCQKLLNAGVPVNVTMDDTGQNFLMKVRNADILKLLLQNGANPNWTDIKGWNVLHRLVTCQHSAELVKILLESGIEVQRRIENGQDALLLTHLLFVETADAITGKEILQLLIQAGADINSSDKDGETLLHLAAYNNAADLAQVALELGADLERPNQRGETPLQLAKRLKADEVLEVLNQHVKIP